MNHELDLSPIEARANAATGPLTCDGSPDMLIFIAHAREDVPALCREVRRLRAELDNARFCVSEENYLRAKLILMRGTGDATARHMAQSIVATMEAPEKEPAHEEA